MPYLKRNSNGAVIALTSTADDPAAELVPADHPEVLRFLAAGSEAGQGSAAMLATDLAMIRVIEDIIDLLIQKNVIMFSELPKAVQDKLLHKKGQREKLFGVGDILSAEDGVI